MGRVFPLRVLPLLWPTQVVQITRGLHDPPRNFVQTSNNTLRFRLTSETAATSRHTLASILIMRENTIWFYSTWPNKRKYNGDELIAYSVF